MKRRLFGFAAVLLLAASCRPGRVVLGPVPDRVESVQGYASIRYARAGASARARLAFVLFAAGKAKLEALDPLNRTMFTVSVDGELAVLTVPSRKAFWSGPRADVLEAGLGFPLSASEMAGMLSGRWPAESEAPAGAWTLTRDGRGRVTAGEREGFSFQAAEFFSGSSAPRRVTFTAAAGGGSLTVLGLSFNAAAPDAAAPASIPSSYTRLTRDEMERLLRDEG